MVTIGFDGSRLTVAQRTGTEHYSAELLLELAPRLGDDRLLLYLNAPEAPGARVLPPGVEPRPIPFPRLWTQARLSWEMMRHPPDVLFVPAHVVPWRHPASIVTIHDLGYLVEPHAHPPAARRFLDWTTRFSVRAARRVIAVSEATKNALIGAYAVPPDKISVIYHGVASRFRPATPAEIARVVARHALPEHYILTVGTVQPRKNLPRLVAAVGQLAAAGLPHRLIIAGKPGWLAERVEDEIAATGSSHLVTRLGYVAEDDLPALYSAAAAVALPSLHEGFGLPLLEALACGVPTLVADRAALPEIAGDAALVVPATDIDAIAAGLTRLLTDQALRARLTAAGRSRAASFSWASTAKQTLKLLRQVAREARGD